MATRSGKKGVSRIQHSTRSGSGWYARVNFEGKTHSKYFADSVHGGTEPALRKAVKWRREKEKELGKPVVKGRAMNTSLQPGQTGVVGVHRSKNSFVAAWSPKKGQLKRQFFSITDLGPEEAFRQAVALRRQKEKDIYGMNLTPNAPTMPKALGKGKGSKAAKASKPGKARKAAQKVKAGARKALKAVGLKSGSRKAAPAKAKPAAKRAAKPAKARKAAKKSAKKPAKHR